MLTGLRGVGKTVLLNALRGQAVRKGWGTGKLEARPDQSLRRPLSSALHQAVRELGTATRTADHVLGVIRVLRRAAGRAGRQAAGTGGAPASTRRPCAAAPTPVTSRSTWSS